MSCTAVVKPKLGQLHYDWVHDHEVVHRILWYLPIEIIWDIFRAYGDLYFMDKNVFC